MCLVAGAELASLVGRSISHQSYSHVSPTGNFFTFFSGHFPAPHSAFIGFEAVSLGVLLNHQATTQELHDEHGPKTRALSSQADARCCLELMEEICRTVQLVDEADQPWEHVVASSHR